MAPVPLLMLALAAAVQLLSCGKGRLTEFGSRQCVTAIQCSRMGKYAYRDVPVCVDSYVPRTKGAGAMRREGLMYYCEKT